MTTVSFITVMSSIAALDITGVTFTDTIPENAGTLCPVFAPKPDNFITDIVATRQSFGSAGIEKMDMEYTMHWQYFHAPLGSGLGLFSVYNAMITNIAAILVKLLNSDAITGAIDLQVQNIERLAPIKDAAGNDYHGCEIAIRIKEFVNG